MIPDEAVEAAAKALLAIDAPRFPWSDLTDEARARFLSNARLTLEAAAPHMRESAPDEKLLRLADDMEAAMSGGPEFIGRTGLRFHASDRIRRILGVESDTF